jgi:hypothetical protein
MPNKPKTNKPTEATHQRESEMHDVSGVHHEPEVHDEKEKEVPKQEVHPVDSKPVQKDEKTTTVIHVTTTTPDAHPTIHTATTTTTHHGPEHFNPGTRLSNDQRRILDFLFVS